MAAVAMEAWRTLYDRAIRIRDVAPWKWMEETEVFGIEDPVSKEVAYISISGALGEHLAVIAYLGSVAVNRFLGIHCSEDGPCAEDLFEMRQIQASFEDREQLDGEDLQTIRSLGLRFRGANAWPLFRSIRPGCYPWFFDETEVRLMTVILEQTEDVVTRVDEDPSILYPSGSTRLLVRRQVADTGGPLWEDVRRPIPSLPAPCIPDLLTDEMVAELLALPRSEKAIEVDLVMMPGTPVREAKDERPYFPYLLLAADAERGIVLGAEFLSPVPSMETMWGSVAPALRRHLTSAGFLPKTVKVRTDIMELLMKKLGECVPLKVRRVKNLPRIGRVLPELMRFQMSARH